MVTMYHKSEVRTFPYTGFRDPSIGVGMFFPIKNHVWTEINRLPLLARSAARSQHREQSGTSDPQNIFGGERRDPIA